MQKQVYKCPDHGLNLNNMRLNNKWCDVIIKVDGREYPAHKNILAANLKHFEAMFSNDDYFQESQNGIATMKNMKATDLEAFITYAYTGEISLTDANVLGLLEIADYIREDGIKKACIEFLEKNLKLDDVCRVYRFASNTECLSLKNAAKATIMNNFEIISQTDDFLDFEYDNVKDILSDRNAQQTMRSQKMLFEGIIRWVIYDAHIREGHTSDLLSLVDIKEFTAEYLMSYLYANIIDGNDEHGISKSVMSCYYACNKSGKARYQDEHLDQALMLIDLTESEICFRSYDFAQKKWYQLQEAPLSDGYSWTRFAVLDDKLYYIGGNSGTMNLRVFDPTKKEIKRLHSLRSIWCLSAMCSCNKFLYFCGGVNADDSRSDQILRYDPKKYSLEIMPSMEGKRNDAAAIFYEGCLYVLGGYDGSSTLNSVEKYDPETKTWSSLPSMTHPRRRHAVAVLEGKLYACGGLNTNSVEVYDKVENSWRPVASMDQNRYYFIVIARQGKLLAIGGNRGKTVEVYDPSTDEWHVDPEMSAGPQMIVIGGGLISRSCITDVEKYDPETERWSSLPSMCRTRSEHSVAVLKGKLYACGGSNTNSVEVYESLENRWKPIAKLNVRRFQFFLVAHEGKLWAVGGGDRSVEFYNPSTDQWQMDPELSSGLKIRDFIGGLISRNCIGTE